MGAIVKAFLTTLFFDRGHHRLRNGWWVLIFIAFIAVTRVIHRPIVDALKQLDAHEAWREPLPVLCALLATWACVRLRRQSLASVGFKLDRRWVKEFAGGIVIGMATLLTAAAMIWATGNVRFELDPQRSVAAMMYGVYVFFFAAMLEEILFRGFLFQRLLDGIGAWGTQIALAALFAAAHWSNPGMEGATRVWATIDISLAAVFLGLAYLRTRSLALPIGLHLGWNWAQGHLLGFGVSGFDHNGWLRPVFDGQTTWLSGGEFGPEASVFGVLTDLILIGLLWKWRGSATAPVAALERDAGSVPALQGADRRATG
ncbi:CPBP family intramembrane glutamic endopeptidase [Montanilutibacter psychrotolerans]|uniref:CPBP family intramembrane metalloprotease n=1 Tax=Montanilutibacter psychrotolerans TaxID=1327343 RepID=A0A3M8SUD8_9GAMM|nr:type II CAAX endopeptidase family protein [Lysobacter psychrotolerans]RNF83086.1 CPBP family intramembrane metalloprotease [Lysobacter psychrotolerans]